MTKEENDDTNDEEDFEDYYVSEEELPNTKDWEFVVKVNGRILVRHRINSMR